MRAVAGVIAAWLGLATTAAVAAPPAPRGPHPRIFLTPPTLAALKARARRSDPRVMSAIELCRHAALEPHDFASSGYQGDAWSFAASSCGLAWRLTGDWSFAKAGVRLWRALMEDVETVGDKKACVPGRPPQTWQASVWRDTGYAIRFVAPHAALAYDWLYDAPGVDDALRRESHDCFISWIDWYTKTGYLNSQPGANYHAGFVFGKALVAVALAGDDPRADRLWSEVVDDLFGAQIVGQGLAGGKGTPRAERPGPLVGGDWPEGWQYGPLSVTEYALGARALEEHGVKLPAVDHWASEVALRALYATTPAGDELYPGGDNDATTFFLPNAGAGLLATIAGPGSAEAAGWAAAVLRRFPKLWTTPVFGPLAAARGLAPHDFLESSRPLWYLAPGTSNMYVRSAWNPGAFWAVFTSSRRLVADHQHPDATNFVFMRGHDPLIVDPSPYGCRSSLTANAVTCDSAVVGGDYKPSQTPWSNAVLSFARATRSGVAAARGDFHTAFGIGDVPSDIPFALRDWVFLPEGEIVTIDCVDTGASTRKTYLRFRPLPTSRSRRGDGWPPACAATPRSLSTASPCRVARRRCARYRSPAVTTGHSAPAAGPASPSTSMRWRSQDRGRSPSMSSTASARTSAPRTSSQSAAACWAQRSTAAAGPRSWWRRRRWATPVPLRRR